LRSIVVGEFSRCASVQLSSAHPEQAPPGCANTGTEKPRGSGDVRATVAAEAAPELAVAAREAASHSFLGALSIILWAIAATAVGLAVISLLLRRPGAVVLP
jgi:hypothetical protein